VDLTQCFGPIDQIKMQSATVEYIIRETQKMR